MSKVFVFGLCCIILSASTALAGGLEFRITFSGKVLLGLAYRHQIDQNTAWRLGAFMGFNGTPVGVHSSILQDVAPEKTWTPLFSLGVDALFVQHKQITTRFYPSATIGFAYCPTPQLKHSAEVWFGWLSNTMFPMGLSYTHFNSIN